VTCISARLQPLDVGLEFTSCAGILQPQHPSPFDILLIIFDHICGQSRTLSLTDNYQLQKRKEEYEALREQRNRTQTELELFELRTKDELQRLEKDIYRLSMSGHQSEPTTPPEYRDNGFPSAISRPNRLSLASMASTPGIGSIASPRANRSGSQSINSSFTAQGISVPGSRRGSDEETDTYQFEITNLGTRRQAT
jgi:hypothetical protein